MTNSEAENQSAIAHLANNNQAAKVNNPGFDSDDRKTVGDFLRKVCVEQPFDDDGLSKKEVRVLIDVKRPTNQTTVADYDKAAWRAIFQKAGYGMLTDQEIALAVGGMNAVGWTIKDSGFDLATLRKEDAKPGAMVLKTNQAIIERATRAGQAVLQYQEYQAKNRDLAIEKGKTYVNQALGGFVQPIVNAPVNIVNGVSEPFRAGEKMAFGTNYIPEMPKMSVAEKSEYWNKDGRLYANKGAEIAATITFGGMAGSKAIVTQGGRALFGVEAGYNVGAGLAGVDVTQTDSQGNARRMEWTERGLRMAGGLLGARQTIKTEISTPNSITNKAVEKLDDVFKNPPSIKPQAEMVTPEGLRIKVNENTFEKPLQTADDLNVKMSASNSGSSGANKYNPTKRTDAELLTDLNPTTRTGETAIEAQKRVQFAQGEIQARHILKIYIELGDSPSKIDIDLNDARNPIAHTIERHGSEIDLVRDSTKKTIEGRIYGDSPWANKTNFSYKWKDAATMNKTINEFIQNNWEEIRVSLANDRFYETNFDAGKAVGEGYFNSGQMGTGTRQSVYHQTSNVKITIELVSGSTPAKMFIVRAYPNGIGK